MKRQSTNLWGVWLGLVGLLLGLALGYFGSGILGQRGLLGSPAKLGSEDKMDLEATMMAIQMERVLQLDKKIEGQVKQLADKTGSGTTTPEDLQRLQNSIDERKRAIEMAADLLKKESQTRSTIVR
jgi:hypothetical protein